MTFDDAKHEPGDCEESYGRYACDGGPPYCEQGPEYEEMMAATGEVEPDTDERLDEFYGPGFDWWDV